jgi:hypothetical protein
MDLRHQEAILGAPMRNFLREVAGEAKNGYRDKVHFVTAREMVNIALAACDGREGNPGDYRDYRLKLIGSEPKSEADGTLRLRAVGRTV